MLPWSKREMLFVQISNTVDKKIQIDPLVLTLREKVVLRFTSSACVRANYTAVGSYESIEIPFTKSHMGNGFSFLQCKGRGKRCRLRSGKPTCRGVVNFGTICP